MSLPNHVGVRSLVASIMLLLMETSWLCRSALAGGCPPPQSDVGSVLDVNISFNLLQLETPLLVADEQVAAARRNEEQTHRDLTSMQREIERERERDRVTETHCDHPSKGFVFVGLGSKDWCHEGFHAVAAIKNASLPCRSLVTTEAGFCKVGFVGDAEGVAIVNANCPSQFDVVSVLDLAACPMPKLDLRAAKMCVRALDAAPFDYNIQMDIGDTLLIGPEIEQIYGALDEGVELASAMACCSLHVHPQNHPIASENLFGGWVMNTGVLGFKKCPPVKEHASLAIQLYSQQQTNGQLFSDGEQSAETLALSKLRVRFLPLPPTFNLRSMTSMGPLRSVPAVVAHWRYNSENKTHAELMAETMKIANNFQDSLAEVDTLPVNYGHNK
jgi:hypothetical protein